MNILVTGGAGFIGSTLSDFLLKEGFYVFIIDNFLTGKRDRLIKHKSCILDLSDHNNVVNLRSLINQHQIDIIYHMAALPSVEQSIQNRILSHKHNLNSTVNLLESIKSTKVKKIIFSSTSAVYGNSQIIPTNENSPTNPLSPYALQKLISEQYIKMYTEIYGIKSVCFRYFNVYGERMNNEGAYKSVLSIFKEQKMNNKLLTITNDGEQRRDFIHVDDVVNANYLAGIKDLNSNFEIFNVGYGSNFSVNEIAKQFNSNVEYIGPRVEPKISLCDNSKIKKFFSWKPTKNVLEWISSYAQD